MGIATESAEKSDDLFMQHRMVFDVADKLRFLLNGWQFPVQQKIADFHEIAASGQLFDRVTAIQQNTLISVDERDG